MSKTTENNQEMRVETNIKIPYTMLHNDVMDCMSFEKPIDKLVYVALLRFAFGKGHAFPSVSKLCYMCSATENTIREAIKRLQEMKLVSIEYRPRKNGDNDSNIYYINDLTEEMKQHTVADPDVLAAAKKADKERRKAKQKAKKEKEALLQNEPTSNFEEGVTTKNPTSNFEVPSSKFEPPTSNFEDKEYLLNKKSLINKTVRKYVVADIDSIYKLYKERFKASTYVKRTLSEFCTTYTADFVQQAVERAVSTEKDVDKPTSYIRSTLSNWIEAGCQTVEDILAYEESFRKEQKEQNQSKQKTAAKTAPKRSTRKEVVPEWLEEENEQKNTETNSTSSVVVPEYQKKSMSLDELMNLEEKYHDPAQRGQLTPEELTVLQESGFITTATV